MIRHLLPTAFLAAMAGSIMGSEHRVYLSEQTAVCYASTEQGLVNGHWECNVANDQCECVVDRYFNSQRHS